MGKGSRRLGRGLSTLISHDLTHQDDDPGDRAAEAQSPLGGLRQHHAANRLLAISVDKIRQNPMQPRRVFDEAGLRALAASLRDKGALQPVLVRPAENGYELVAGERRLRAAKLAGLKEVPAIVRSVPDGELLELALVENIHRTDLNAVDRARAYRVLHERDGLSHEEIARRVGEERTTVSNFLRLLGHGEEILAMVSAGDLGAGHAKALLGISDPKIRISIAQRAVRDAWSVRQVEAAVAGEKRGRPASPGDRKNRPVVADMEQKLRAALGTRVFIREGRRRHSGKLVIEYYSLDDFERLTGLLGVTKEPS